MRHALQKLSPARALVRQVLFEYETQIRFNKKRRVLCKKKEGEVDGWRKTLKLYVLLIFLNKLSFIPQLLVMAGIDVTV